MNNIGYKAPGKNCGDEIYWTFQNQYKFNICFENTNQKNYITEKFMNAYLGNCIPIYRGTNQVFEWFNKDAFLYLENDSDEAMDKLIEQIIKIDNDHNLFNYMINQPLILDIPKCMDKNTWKEKINEIYNKNQFKK